jgi:uncharacterized protein (TIGR03435 family)
MTLLREKWLLALSAGAATVLLVLGLAPLHLAAGRLPGTFKQQATYPTPAQKPGTPRLEFDVVSVKPSNPDARGGGVQPMPGYRGYIGQNVPLFTLMTVAYGVTGRQIQGAPGWVTSDRWDIEAKSDEQHSIDELHIMLENAIEDRFQLKLHHETRQESVQSLEVDKGGAKLKEHEPPNDTNSPPITMRPEPGPDGSLSLTLSGTNISMSYLAFFLSRAQQRAVLDNTGLQGHYDINVKFELPPPPAAAPDLAPDLSPLFEALRAQLGLHVDKGAKGPVDYLVIESVQKATGN